MGCDGTNLLVDGNLVFNSLTTTDTLCSEVVGIDADLGDGDDRFDVRGLGGLPILNVVDVDGGAGTDGFVTEPGVGIAGNPVVASVEVTVFVGTGGDDDLLADPGQPAVNGVGVSPLPGTTGVVLDGAGGDDPTSPPSACSPPRSASSTTAPGAATSCSASARRPPRSRPSAPRASTGSPSRAGSTRSPSTAAAAATRGTCRSTTPASRT